MSNLDRIFVLEMVKEILVWLVYTLFKTPFFFVKKFNFRKKLALTPPSAAGARTAALSSLRSLFRGLHAIFDALVEIFF